MAGMYPPAREGGKPRASGTDTFPFSREGGTRDDAAGRTASTGFFQTLVQDARTASADAVPAGDENRVLLQAAGLEAHHHHARRARS